MNKIISAALLLGTVLTAHAEGYQVNTLSAKQLGMGHAGVALNLGAESQIFNPGAMAFSDKTIELSGSFVAIDPHATCTYQGAKYDTDNKISTPMNVAASFKVYDNLYAGLSFYTPAGSAINWGDNWPGAVLNQKVDIKVYTIQPTLSWRITPKFSVGAGLMVTWGSVDLSKALVNAASLDRLIAATGMQLPAFGNVAPASVNLKGSSNTRVGVNLGAKFDIDSRWSVGASFRSCTRLTVKKGDAAVTYANDAAKMLLHDALKNLDATNFTASLPNPYMFTFGGAFKPVPNVTIAADLQLNGWKSYKRLDVEFDQQEGFNQHLTKNYKNALTYHVGAQWGVTRRLDLRAGMMIDTNPCDKSYYNPETPGQTRIEPSVGFSFRPIENLSVDFAFMYVQGLGTKGVTGEYEDFIAKRYPMLQLPEVGTFTADYKVHAFIPAVGLSYKF